MTFLEVYSILIPIITLLALLYAAVQDLLFREVRHEFIWLIMIGSGLLLNILYLIFYDGARAFSAVLAEMLLNIVLGFFLGFLLFYVGAWGGADSKALWSLAILVPLHPFLERSPFLFLPESPILILDSAILSILLNSALFSLFYPVVLLLINSVRAVTRKPLFVNVQGSSFAKARCLLFGYQKDVAKINPKKLHFDFLEALPERMFTGCFTGDFHGRLDGSFLGFFDGSFSGEFSGKIIGKVLPSSSSYDEEEVESIIAEARAISQQIAIEKKDEEDAVDYVLRKYQNNLFEMDHSITFPEGEKLLTFEGRSFGAFSGLFIGLIEGVFDGDLSGKVIGQLSGDFFGTSPKGKLSGTKTPPRCWQLKMRFGLEDEVLMEKRQLRTLWQLNITEKRTVWVTPSIPFVFLMFLGFLLYLFFGNFLLFLFRLS